MRTSSYLLPLLLGCTALAGCVVEPMPGQLAPGQYAPGSAVSATDQVTDQVTEAPPPLPNYEQPPIPAEGYIWTPGFWQYGRGGYYWVPGVWVEPPSVGLLWTPGYWAFTGGYYRWNAPYWGPTVGYYGGINYGFGYFGLGYEGGRWEGRRFRYNETVNNFGGRRITNVYNAPVHHPITPGRTSFNGGPNGVRAQPGPGQAGPGPGQRRPPTPAQTQHFQSAQGNAGIQPRPTAGAAPGGQFNRPGGQNTAQPVPQRPTYQQPNVGQAPQRPAAQAPQVQQRPQPAQPFQQRPAPQAPQVQQFQQRPQPQRSQPQPPPPQQQPQQQHPAQRPPLKNQQQP